MASPSSSASATFDEAALRPQVRRIRFVAMLALVVAVAVAATGLFVRSRREAALTVWTDAQAVPSVAVVTPQRGVGNQELVLPGDIKANHEAPIHARVNGYLKAWYKDIGAHVEAGDLLAEIDTPDLDQQLSQAKADLATAKANEALADLTAKRWKAVLDSHAVSEQVTDEKLGEAAARKAQTHAAEANVQRLEALAGFKRIVAPFDGIVTARNTDVGALIDANDSGAALFDVADTHRMRVYVQVPQAFIARLRPGMKAELKLPQYPDEVFASVLDTTSNAVAQGSRTALAEFIADNGDGKLWPGTYAQARLQLAADADALRVPTSALLFRQDGLKLAVLDGDGKVALKSVVVGRDLGTQVEVLSGVSPNDRIIDTPFDSIAAGDVVRVAAAKAVDGASKQGATSAKKEAAE